jgi:hypothetical protein
MTLNYLLVVWETLQDANSNGVMSYLLINGTWLPVGLSLGTSNYQATQVDN